jgi:hypothetical protein
VSLAGLLDLWGVATLGFGAKVNPGARSDPPALWEPSDWSRFANARTRRAKERRASSATARNPASRQGCFRSPCETSKDEQPKHQESPSCAVLLLHLLQGGIPLEKTYKPKSHRNTYYPHPKRRFRQQKTGWFMSLSIFILLT